MDGAGGATELSHRERRVLFSKLLASLVLWANERPGWGLALDEGTIHSPRDYRTEMGQTFQAQDGVHRPGSYHYLGQAQDLLLYVHGAWVSDGDSAEWRLIAERWESLHPLCTSGRRWKDAGHVSLGEGRRDGPLP